VFIRARLCYNLEECVIVRLIYVHPSSTAHAAGGCVDHGGFIECRMQLSISSVWYKTFFYHNIYLPTAQQSYCTSITKTNRVIRLRDMIRAVMKQWSIILFLLPTWCTVPLFCNICITYLDMFRATLCPFSGGQNCIFTASGIVTLCDLLKMSIVLLETCRGI
jgi:hypothetical protein